MKSKEEILDHLAHTVYTHNARKSIIQWMLQHHVVDYKCQIKFAKHVYNRDGVRLTEGYSFEDFDNWLGGYEIEIIEKQATELLEDFLRELNCNTKNENMYSLIRYDGKSAKELTDACAECIENIKNGWIVTDGKIVVDNFQIGDAVKYMPTPDESTTEYVEAIAHDDDGGIFLCLSNGEYVRPSHCVRYKVQGEKRRELINRLNEVE